jgi:hypothetical protein
MAKVADFLEKVSSDEAFEKEFDKNPKKVMDEFGLTPQQQDLIREGTAKKIRDVIKGELGKDVIVIMVKMH